MLFSPVIDNFVNTFCFVRWKVVSAGWTLAMGSRMIVLPQNRKSVLAKLHEAHPGSTGMIALIQMYMYVLWSDIDSNAK